MFQKFLIILNRSETKKQRKNFTVTKFTKFIEEEEDFLKLRISCNAFKLNRTENFTMNFFFQGTF